MTVETASHWTCNVRDDADDLHVVPVYPGEREHQTSPQCWCQPSHLGVMRGKQAWSHHRKAEA